MHFSSLLLGASALLVPVFAQTSTDCNPLKQTCPDNPGFGIDHDFVFNTSATVDTSFNITAGALTYGKDGAEFVVSKRGDSPTIKSNFYIFFGSISVIMKAASGQGIVSSIVIESEDLDEIDWEFIGGNGTHGQTNYFGKGNITSYDRAKWHPVPGDLRDNFHNYTVDWTREQIDFYVDYVLVRTLKYGDANGGNNFPQTPSTVRLGIWAGGDPGNNPGTIAWAGGSTDFAKAPYTMYVQSASIQDYGSGKDYRWADRTGTWESIVNSLGNSTAADRILRAETTTKSTAQKFHQLSQTSKIAIYCGGGAAAACLIFACLFTCIRQRRNGKAQREAYNASIENERENIYQEQMELREKGLGGWDKGAYASQGDDALGGWASKQGARDSSVSAMPKLPTNVSVNEVPSRVTSPVARNGTPSQWNGGNQGSMIQNPPEPYSGLQQNGIPRSPGFPPQGGGFGGGFSGSSYQRL